MTQATQVFDRVNLDLMYGLPGQTLQMACEDLAMGLSLGVGHLSLYQLTIRTQYGLRQQAAGAARKARSDLRHAVGLDEPTGSGRT